MKKRWMLSMIIGLSCVGSFALNALEINRVQRKEGVYPLYPIISPYKQDYLKVSQTHSLFYATYGNPNGMPVVILHGGPGGGCDDSLTQFFDLNYWHVIMFDQRGAMRSTPFACMEENSLQDTVTDIEALRKHLGISQWVVFGGSCGSTLGLLYGQTYPESCLGFILRGIFLGRQQDYLHLFYGMGKIFPEAYQSMVEHIPHEEREDLLLAYYKRVMDADPNIHLPAARAFMKFDIICSTHLPNNENVEKALSNDERNLSIGRAYIYYSYHHFFLQPNQLLEDMPKIAHLPAIIVQGRWDAICLPEMAHSLHQKWENSALWMIPDGGHAASNPTISQALTNATDLFTEYFADK